MSKHTPGPWKLAEAVEGRYTKTNLRRIRSGCEGTEHGAVCEVYGIADGTEAHANARLIAAAPDLLTAAKHLLAALNAKGTAIPEKAGDELVTAIAKAEEA